jgi:hypothetical protein
MASEDAWRSAFPAGRCRNRLAPLAAIFQSRHHRKVHNSQKITAPRCCNGTGLAFKTRNASATKNNLMIFIRPTILRDQSQATAKTQQTYDYMIDQGRSTDRRELLPVLPGERQPSLPPLPDTPARP